MSWSVKNGWHPPVGQFSRKSDAQQMARQMRDANRQAGISGAVKVIRTGSGTQKNPTKAQRRERTRKASVQRRVAVALAKFLKQANPAMKTAGASIQKLKGGVIKITPIKANAGTKYTGGGVCVRCGRRKATRLVRAPNGSKDAVCGACSVSSGLGAGGAWRGRAR